MKARSDEWAKSDEGRKVLAGVQGVCESLATVQSETSEHRKELPYDARTRDQTELRALETFCGGKRSKEDAKKMLAAVEMSAEIRKSLTCRLSVVTYSATLWRVSSDKWASRGEPSGACNVINVHVLEREGDFWSYSQSRVSADTKSEMCKHVSLGTARFTWKIPGFDIPGCQVLELGF